ncbi:DUF2946 domain-containing protein [Dyella sp.]|uniref:DUF2946 domain-containing protein n=1 Tax=Dyella sp. TaxID=1869338 RepID=UPI002D79F8DE|nr:DUF2946 domain-containing protein [Dyella sp.]HET7332569.1 DUF2946 domain-containing protein [Dyella sp.]
MLKRAAQQRFVAWLALAAMALIVLMPVVSRSMPMGGMAMGMSSAPDDGCPLHAAHPDHRHAGMPEHPDDPTARCGYCVLFSHVPVVGLGIALVLPSLQHPSFVPRTTMPRRVPAEPWLSARPRGPPLFVEG